MAIYLDGLHSPSKPMLSTSEMGYKHVVYQIIFTFGEQAWEPISVMGCTLHYPKNNVRYIKGIELERDATVSAPNHPTFPMPFLLSSMESGRGTVSFFLAVIQSW